MCNKLEEKKNPEEKEKEEAQPNPEQKECIDENNQKENLEEQPETEPRNGKTYRIKTKEKKI